MADDEDIVPGMPPWAQFKSECLRKGLTGDDAGALWNYWLANGYKNGVNKVKSWKATINYWKLQRRFPSQRPGYKPSGLQRHERHKPKQLEEAEQDRLEMDQAREKIKEMKKKLKDS